MKTQTRKEAKKQVVSKKVRVNPALNGKYDDQPIFQDKVARANYILKIAGIPKFG